MSSPISELLKNYYTNPKVMYVCLLPVHSFNFTSQCCDALRWSHLLPRECEVDIASVSVYRKLSCILVLHSSLKKCGNLSSSLDCIYEEIAYTKAIRGRISRSKTVNMYRSLAHNFGLTTIFMEVSRRNEASITARLREGNFRKHGKGVITMRTRCRNRCTFEGVNS